jgi:hypothetical protein
MNTCPLCGFAQAAPVFEGYGFDSATEFFAVVRCMGFRSGRIEALPASDALRLRNDYSSDYYGSAEQRFFGAAFSFAR